MEKKETKKKSNKKGTASAKKTTTSKNVTPVKKVNAEVNKDTSVKKEIIKEEKIQKPNVSTNEEEFGGDEIRKLLIIIGAVCAVMLAFYFITSFVIKPKDEKKNESEETPTEQVIQYEQILMGELFNQNEDNYYVLAFVEDDPMLEVYTNYIKTYSEKEDAAKIYRVNLSDDMNKQYLGDENYIEGSNISKIKLKGTTLIRITNHNITTSYTDFDAIVGKFTRLIG